MSGVISNIVQTVVAGTKALLGMQVEVVEEIEQTVDAAGVRAIDVQASSGSIALQAAGTDHVTVHAWKTVRGPSREEAEEFARQVEVRIERLKDVVGVYVEVPEPHVGYHVSVRFEVTGPPALAADLRTSSGSIQFAGTKAAVTAETHSGGIKVQDSQGDIALRTRSGGIQMARVEGVIQAQTGSGRIELREGVGSVRLRTRSGRIRAVLQRLESEGTFDAQSGSIHVDIREGVAPITAVTSSGSIRLTLPAAFSGQFRAQASSGGISCELPFFEVQESSQRYLRGRIGEGGETAVNLRTHSGGIQVRAH